MATLSRSQILEKYNDPDDGLYKANTTKAINSSRIRTNVEDESDSNMNLVDDFGKYIRQGAATGTDTYAVTITTAASVYASEALFIVSFPNTSTGSATLNINAGGAKKLFKDPSTQAGAGDIVSGTAYLLLYQQSLDGGSGAFLMIGGVAGISSVAFADITGDADDNASIVAYVDAQIGAAVAGLLDIRGTYDASVNAYPSSGGSGTAGAILKGDAWYISVAGTLPTTQAVQAGDLIFAIVDTPGSTQANWARIERNLTYDPVNKAGDSMSGNLAMGGNKVTGLGAASSNGEAVRYEQLPGAASPSTAGITKLYTSSGSNTDGTMDQNSITNAISTAIAGVGGTLKTPVTVATTGNITLSGEQTIDGILTSNSRVLVWQQTTGANNGIYVSSSGSWTRATDADTQSELNGMFVKVQQGTRFTGKFFYLETNNPTVGSTSLVYYPIQAYDLLSISGVFSNQPFVTAPYAGYRPATAGVPRIYIIPNGTPSGTRSKFELFFTDYASGSSDYAGFNIFGSDSPNEWHIGANVGGSGPTVNQYYGFYVGSALQTSKAYREMLNSTNIVNDFAPGGHRLKHFVLETSSQTGAATLALSDWHKLLDFNSASDANITVPANSSVAFPIGTPIPWFQRGAGKMTFVQGSGAVTIISLGSLYQSAGQGARGYLLKVGTDTWSLSGQLI